MGFTALQYIAGSVLLIALTWVYGHPGRTDWGSGVAVVSMGQPAAEPIGT